MAPASASASRSSVARAVGGLLLTRAVAFGQLAFDGGARLGDQRRTLLERAPPLLVHLPIDVGRARRSVPVLYSVAAAVARSDADCASLRASVTAFSAPRSTRRIGWKISVLSRIRRQQQKRDDPEDGDIRDQSRLPLCGSWRSSKQFFISRLRSDLSWCPAAHRRAPIRGGLCANRPHALLAP